MGRRSVLDARMEHLTCFVAGNLALGAHSGAVNGSKADEFLALAQNLTHTCYQMYRQMPTGRLPPLCCPAVRSAMQS